MISQDDIDAFTEEGNAAIEAANEYARRKRKGIPPDRWATTYGQFLVARGIEEYARRLDALSDTVKVLMEEKAQAAKDSMTAHIDPLR